MPPKLLSKSETTESERVIDRALDAVENNNKTLEARLASVEKAILDMNAAVTGAIVQSARDSTRTLILVVTVILALSGARDFYMFKFEAPGVKIETQQAAPTSTQEQGSTSTSLNEDSHASE